MNWKWKGKKCLGLCSHSTHGYRLMTTGPQRLNGIPRRCTLRTLLASRVSLPDNTCTYSPSCSHTYSFRKKCGNGVVMGAKERAWATWSVTTCCCHCGYSGFQLIKNERMAVFIHIFMVLKTSNCWIGRL